MGYWEIFHMMKIRINEPTAHNQDWLQSTRRWSGRKVALVLFARSNETQIVQSTEMYPSFLIFLPFRGETSVPRQNFLGHFGGCPPKVIQCLIVHFPSCTPLEEYCLSELVSNCTMFEMSRYHTEKVCE